MSYGFLAVNSEQTILINSDDTSEKLYLRRPHDPLGGSPGYGTIVVNSSTHIGRLNELTTPLPFTSIIFFRPVTDGNTVSAYSGYTSNGLVREFVVTCDSDVEWMIFDEVGTGDLTDANLTNDYGLNIYKADNSLHWSSNALNARVKAVLESPYSTTSIATGRKPWATPLSSRYSITFTVVGYGADKEYYIHYNSWAVAYSGTSATIASKTITSGPLQDTGGLYNTIYYTAEPKILVADLGDLPT